MEEKCRDNYLTIQEWYKLPYFYDISRITVIKKSSDKYMGLHRYTELRSGNKVQLPRDIGEDFYSDNLIVTGIYPKGESIVLTVEDRN